MPNPTALFGSLAGIAAWSILSSGAVPKLAEKKSQVLLIRLEPEENDAVSSLVPSLRLQYFPESIQDSKQVNYAQKAVPGASVPLYQWINGAERTISFTTMFSTDVDLSLDPRYAGELKDLGMHDRNVNVAAAVAWLRSFMLPRYDAWGGTLPPAKVRLVVENSGIGSAGGTTLGGLPFPAVDSSDKRDASSIDCVMTQCDVEWKAFFPTGTPRLASVQLAFAQVAQLAGVVTFPQETAAWTKEVSDEYKLRP